jgi:hypothetical protein
LSCKPQNPPPAGTPPPIAPGTPPEPQDDALALIFAAWPTLPEPLRAAVLAIIETAKLKW